MNVVSLLFLLLATSFVFAQKQEFGSVSMQDFDKKNFAGDTAAAVILFDAASVLVDRNSQLGTTYTRQIRLKILRKEALSKSGGEWGNRTLYIETGSSIKIKAATFNLENGAIRRYDLDDRSILRTKYDRELEHVNLAFSNVVEGSVIDLYYVEKHSSAFIPRFIFQDVIPTRWSEYTISGGTKVNYFLFGSVKPVQHEEKYEGTYHRWVLTNIPAFVPEPQMPAWDNYISFVGFGSMRKSWNEIHTELVEDPRFFSVIKLFRYLNETAEELTTGMTDEKQKIKAISDYVKNQITFNNLDFFLGSNLTELMEKKSGSSGEINLLLASLLDKAGLKVNMVLLSTRGHGSIIEEVPAFWQFNYVVCEVVTKEGEILVDATEKLLPYDMLPPRCYNQKGFLVGESQLGWISVQPKHRDKITFDVTVTLTESGGLTGKLKSYKDGFAAFKARKKKTDENEKKDSTIDLDDDRWKIENYAFKNLNTIDKPFEETCDLSIEEIALVTDDHIYLNPHLFLREENNPFKTETRKYPIEFPKLIDNTVICNLTVPENYIVEELPENKVFILPGNTAKCTFSTTQTGNKVVVMSKLQFNKTRFEPAEYAKLKEFYANVVAKKAENIVLKKKQ